MSAAQDFTRSKKRNLTFSVEVVSAVGEREEMQLHVNHYIRYCKIIQPNLIIFGSLNICSKYMKIFEIYIYRFVY